MLTLNIFALADLNSWTEEEKTSLVSELTRQSIERAIETADLSKADLSSVISLMKLEASVDKIVLFMSKLDPTFSKKLLYFAEKFKVEFLLKYYYEQDDTLRRLLRLRSKNTENDALTEKIVLCKRIIGLLHHVHPSNSILNVIQQYQEIKIEKN